MEKNIFPLCLFVFFQVVQVFSEGKVEEVFKWNQVEYEDLPEPVDSRIGLYEYYIPENNNIVSFGYHPESELMIVVILRPRPGVPVTLGAFCVQDYETGSSPKIWGYPNYQLNALKASDFMKSEDENQSTTIETTPEDNRIISVFHITIDEKCNRVFFIDCGLLEYYGNVSYVIEKPALWVIDLPSDGCKSRQFPIIRRTEIPDQITTKGSNGFMHVVLDYQSESCDDLFLYLTNAFYNYLVVYDYQEDKFWSFEHETFQPVIAESDFLFNKDFNYHMAMGIISLALGNTDENGDREGIYTPLSGTAQYSVSTKILKDSGKSPANFQSDDFRISGYRGCNHQSLKTVIDQTQGVMFYSEVQSNQLRCWNIKKPMNLDNIDVVYESNDFEFGAQMFIDSGGYLWFQNTQIPIIFFSGLPLDLEKVTSRIFRVKVSDVTQGTVCED